MRKQYTTKVNNYIYKHNYIMDSLLWGYSESKYGRNKIRWIDNNLYEPISAEGAIVLEYLRYCDLIDEVTEND